MKWKHNVLTWSCIIMPGNVSGTFWHYMIKHEQGTMYLLDMVFRLCCHVSHDLVTWSIVAVEWLCMEGSRRFHMEHHGISWKSMEGHGRFQNILLTNAVLHSLAKVYIRAAVLAQVDKRNIPICDSSLCDHLWLYLRPICVTYLWPPFVTTSSDRAKPDEGW